MARTRRQKRIRFASWNLLLNVLVEHTATFLDFSSLLQLRGACRSWRVLLVARVSQGCCVRWSHSLGEKPIPAKIVHWVVQELAKHAPPAGLSQFGICCLGEHAPILNELARTYSKTLASVAFFKTCCIWQQVELAQCLLPHLQKELTRDDLLPLLSQATLNFDPIMVRFLGSLLRLPSDDQVFDRLLDQARDLETLAALCDSQPNLPIKVLALFVDRNMLFFLSGDNSTLRKWIRNRTETIFFRVRCFLRHTYLLTRFGPRVCGVSYPFLAMGLAVRDPIGLLVTWHLLTLAARPGARVKLWYLTLAGCFTMLLCSGRSETIGTLLSASIVLIAPEKPSQLAVFGFLVLCLYLPFITCLLVGFALLVDLVFS